ncbi:MAG: hypothetical protein NT069_06795 [Planctomycetota bacterium]|nr:hypothetical protein [Planctomycetota bacterium]
MASDTESLVILMGVIFVVATVCIGLVWMAMHISEHGLWRNW